MNPPPVKGQPISASAAEPVRGLAPGLGLVVLGVALAHAAHFLLVTVSPLTFAVLFGVLLGNMPVSLRPCVPGLDFAAKRLLRVGIVLLGLQLVVTDVLQLGASSLLVVVVVVVVTFSGPSGSAERWGCPPEPRCSPRFATA